MQCWQGVLSAHGSHGDRQGHRHTRPGGDHRFIEGSTHAHSRHHTTTARLLSTREVASAHGWGPEAVGCGLLSRGPDPAGCLPPGQLREGAAGVGPRPGKGERAGEAGALGPVGVPTSLQGLQHQQLLQHLCLAGLTDLTRQEHLVHDRVHLSEGGEKREPSVSKGARGADVNLRSWGPRGPRARTWTPAEALGSRACVYGGDGPPSCPTSGSPALVSAGSPPCRS